MRQKYGRPATGVFDSFIIQEIISQASDTCAETTVQYILGKTGSKAQVGSKQYILEWHRLRRHLNKMLIEGTLRKYITDDGVLTFRNEDRK